MIGDDPGRARDAPASTQPDAALRHAVNQAAHQADEHNAATLRIFYGGTPTRTADGRPTWQFDFDRYDWGGTPDEQG